jgi:hypothetical protein
MGKSVKCDIEGNILQSIQKVLLEEWDPIGVGDMPEAQDEYNSYASTIFELLMLNKSKSEIFDFLWWVETEHMEMEGDIKKTEKIVERILEISH